MIELELQLFLTWQQKGNLSNWSLVGSILSPDRDHTNDSVCSRIGLDNSSNSPMRCDYAVFLNDDNISDLEIVVQTLPLRILMECNDVLVSPSLSEMSDETLALIRPSDWVDWGKGCRVVEDDQ